MLFIYNDQPAIHLAGCYIFEEGTDMILYNYSSLRNRDTKIYNIGGYNMAGGLSIEFLKVVAPVAGIFIAVGAVLSLLLGFSFFNPLSANFHAWYTIIWLALGIGIGCGLWFIQFSGYRLYEYLIAYFKPKKVYSNSFKITEYKFTNFKIKAMVRNIL